MEKLFPSAWSNYEWWVVRPPPARGIRGPPPTHEAGIIAGTGIVRRRIGVRAGGGVEVRRRSIW
jgi:hypothetical protein